MTNDSSADKQGGEDEVFLLNFLGGALQDGEPALPLPDPVFALLVPAFDLSIEEWLRLLNLDCEAPSRRREMFNETIDRQVDWLAMRIFDDNPCAEGAALARRVSSMPRLLRIAIIETLERFWTRPVQGSVEEALTSFGVCPCESAHARLHALARRRRLDRLLFKAPKDKLPGAPRDNG